MTTTVNIAMLGSKFMGRAHSNAWLNVAKFFDVDPRPTMHTVVGRNASELCEFAERWGWQHHTTDWHAAVTSDEIGLVDIGTPNNVHAEQAIAALDANMAVFCQKPLARNARETESVIEAARRADRLLGVDMPYRFVRGVREIKERIEAGAIGDVYAMDLAFHNAYGPDKPWYYDPELAGGGCAIDLGIHLVDMALWLTGANATAVSSRLYAQGKPIRPEDHRLEDYAAARLDFDSGATANLACSWHLNAGSDAVICASFYGTKGGLALRNVNGSFYDFVAEELIGTERKVIAEPPDGWGGRAVVDWAARLAASPAFDPAIESAAAVARVIDAIYAHER